MYLVLTDLISSSFFARALLPSTSRLSLTVLSAAVVDTVSWVMCSGIPFTYRLQGTTHIHYMYTRNIGSSWVMCSGIPFTYRPQRTTHVHYMCTRNIGSSWVIVRHITPTYRPQLAEHVYSSRHLINPSNLRRFHQVSLQAAQEKYDGWQSFHHRI